MYIMNFIKAGSTFNYRTDHISILPFKKLRMTFLVPPLSVLPTYQKKCIGETHGSDLPRQNSDSVVLRH